MELLNFYSKILPDKLFTKKAKPIEKSIDAAFQHIVNQHVSDTKIAKGSWLDQFNQVSYKNQNFNERENVNSNNMQYTNIEALNFNYNVVKNPKDFKHNNMFHNKGGYTIIQGEIIPQPVFNKNPIIENFLGNSYDRIPVKQEVPNMFKPEEGIFAGNKVPIDVDSLKKRYVTSDRRNDAILTDPQRVPPGFGRDANDNSQRGLQSLVRIIPRNVDQLRNANHQKVSYGSVVTPGQMSYKQPIVAPFEKRTADTFIVDRKTEKGRAQKTETKQEGEYDILPTGRDMCNKGYSGPAYNAATYNKEQRLAYVIEEPNKNELKEPEPLGPTSVVKAQTVNDPTSIHLHETQRQTMANNTYKPGVSAGVYNTKAVNYFDLPKETIKQTTSVNKDERPISRSTYGNKETYFNPNDLARETIKQTTSVNIDERPVSRSTYGNKETYFNPNDLARETVKQTTIGNPNQLGYIMSGVQVKGQSFNPNDLPKSTVKETTLRNADLLGYTTSAPVPHGTTVDYNDLARETIKETTVSLKGNENFGTVTSAPVQEGPAFDPFNLPKDTTKQTTLYNPNNLGSTLGSSSKYGSVAFDPTNVARETIKETNVVNIDERPISRSNFGNKERVWDPTDLARETVKETTVINTDERPISRSTYGNKERVWDPTDIARETIKETTVVNTDERPISRTNFGNKERVYNPEDKPKETVKQTTLLQNWVSHSHLINGDGMGYISNPQEFKTTQREIQVEFKPFNQGGSTSQHKKGWVVEEENITMRDCKNEIEKGVEKHYPTKVSLAHIPQINTQGSQRLPHVVVDNRDYIPNKVINVPCTVGHTGYQASMTPAREVSLLDRVSLEAESSEKQRTQYDLTRNKIQTQHDVFIQY
jgi:hypothetical protein